MEGQLIIMDKKLIGVLCIMGFGYGGLWLVGLLSFLEIIKID